MNTKLKIGLGSIGLAVSLACSSMASATLLSVTLGTGASKDNQNIPGIGDLSSKYGATIAGTTVSFETTTGVWTVGLGNVGEGIVTSFALSLNGGLFSQANYDGLGYSFTPASCTVAPAGCSFDDKSFGALAVDGFENSGGTFDIGAVASTPPPQEGLSGGESGVFTWKFTGDFSAVDEFTDLIDPLLVRNPGDDCDPFIGTSNDCRSFRAFWVSHVQGLAGGASDFIGGQVRGQDVPVPEPGVLLLLGAGLAGMGLVRRRKPR